MEIASVLHEMIAPALGGIAASIASLVEPQAVILYGSRARGEARVDSDYDVYVIVDGESTVQSTEHALRHVLDRQGLRLEFIVGPASVYESRRDDVGTLEYQVARDGIVLYARPGAEGSVLAGPARVREPGRGVPKSVAEWLKRADDNRRMALFALGAEPPMFDDTGFAAHEATEKLLKATIIATNTAPPRIHDLTELVTFCPPEIRTSHSIQRSCELLEKTWPKTRYPGNGSVSADEARAAVAAMELIRDAALSFTRRADPA